ncbi:hypothetical protein [Lacihabitans soyangensis]|uniref:Uncharacterized protein n=1 Tax=Lacihabitans soyangensis TaxID=869394 RepID=A0AAE3H494_9BACT|nr:hypothetical protein [Lacihabitans soyangensis]MCP9764493.1 hypothetical protein [Lacihabitans soyangensis]
MTKARVELRDFKGNSPNDLDVKEWRSKVEVLLGQMSSTRGLSKQLGEHDEFFKTTEGYWAAKNVKESRGGLGVTVRVARALEKLVESEAKVSKRLTRKKLVSETVVLVVVWGMLLGLTMAPAAAQRMDDGCMKAVVEDPSANVGATMIVSGLIIFMISTVTWMWWWDYKNRMGDKAP